MEKTTGHVMTDLARALDAVVKYCTSQAAEARSAGCEDAPIAYEDVAARCRMIAAHPDVWAGIQPAPVASVERVAGILHTRYHRRTEASCSNDEGCGAWVIANDNARVLRDAGLIGGPS